VIRATTGDTGILESVFFANDTSVASINMTIQRGLAFACGTVTEIKAILDEIDSFGARLDSLENRRPRRPIVFHYEQPTDPGAVGAGKWWADTTPGAERVGRRNDANDAWVFVFF
jgi:hypothetical protein